MDDVCAFNPCENANNGSRGFCNGHYKQFLKGWELAPLRKTGDPYRECKFEGCSNKHDSYDLCATHSKKLRKGLELSPLRKVGNDPLERDEEGRKLCYSCDRWLLEVNFHSHSRRKDGLYSSCKDCANNQARMKRYSMDEYWYDNKLLEQNGCCPICRREFSKNLLGHVDHDHNCCPGKYSCGKCLRDILCWTCNKGIGQLNDDIDRLKFAVDYLQKHKRQNG